MSTPDDSQPTPHDPYAAPAGGGASSPGHGSSAPQYGAPDGGAPQSAPSNPYGPSTQADQYTATESYGQTDPYGQGNPQPRNGLGTAGLVMAIIALCLCWVPLLGVLLAVIALPLAIVGRRRVSRGGATNRGVATAGVVLSAVALLLALIFTVILVALAGSLIDVFEGCDGQQANDEVYQQCLDDGFRDAFS